MNLHEEVGKLQRENLALKAAADDLARFLELAPAHESAGEVRALLESLRTTIDATSCS